MKRHRFLSTFCLSVALVAVAGCSKKKSDDVSVSLVPFDPVVIEADYTVPDGDGEKTYSAPWYKMQIKVSNPTDEIITVVAVKMETTNVKSGAVVKSETDLTSDLDDFSYLSMIDPKKVDQLLGSDISGVATSGWTFFDSGLPEADSFRYSGTVTLIGWFGDINNPKERFEKKVRFRTQ